MAEIATQEWVKDLFLKAVALGYIKGQEDKELEMKEELLWSKEYWPYYNYFKNGDVIEVDLTNYLFVRIEAVFSDGPNPINSYPINGFCIVGEDCIVGASNNTTELYTRALRTDNNGITALNSVNSENNKCLPVKIYGITFE